MLTRELEEDDDADDDADGEELAWERGKTRAFLFSESKRFEDWNKTLK